MIPRNQAGRAISDLQECLNHVRTQVHKGRYRATMRNIDKMQKYLNMLRRSIKTLSRQRGRKWLKDDMLSWRRPEFFIGLALGVLLGHQVHMWGLKEWILAPTAVALLVACAIWLNVISRN